MHVHTANHILLNWLYLKAVEEGLPLPLLPHHMHENPCGFCGGHSSAGIYIYPPTVFMLLVSSAVVTFFKLAADSAPSNYYVLMFT